MLTRGDWHDGYAPTDQERDPSDAPRGAGARRLPPLLGPRLPVVEIVDAKRPAPAYTKRLRKAFRALELRALSTGSRPA